MEVIFFIMPFNSVYLLSTYNLYVFYLLRPLSFVYIIHIFIFCKIVKIRGVFYKLTKFIFITVTQNSKYRVCLHFTRYLHFYRISCPPFLTHTRRHVKNVVYTSPYRNELSIWDGKFTVFYFVPSLLFAQKKIFLI